MAQDLRKGTLWGFGIEDMRRFQTTARCVLAQHCAEEGAGGGQGVGGPCIRGGATGLPAPPLSLRSFKYGTKREDRAGEGRVGRGRQNTVRSAVQRGKGVEMDQR